MNATTKSYLTLEDIRRRAPAVFAQAPRSTLSSRYEFLPTEKVISYLIDQGIQPTLAYQRRTRVEGRATTVKHTVSFDLSPFVAAQGDVVPEFYLSNSHDGLHTYNFSINLRRADSDVGVVVDSDISMKHIGNNWVSDVTKVMESIVEKTKTIYSLIDAMQKRTLTPVEKYLLASKAAKLRWKDTSLVTLSDVAKIHKEADVGKDDLWTVLNVLTANIIRGGFYAKGVANPTKFRRVREIRSLDARVKFQQELFKLAEEFLNGTPAAVAATPPQASV